MRKIYLLLFFYVIFIAIVLNSACMFTATQVKRTPIELTHPVVYKELSLKPQVGVLKTEADIVNGLLQAKVIFKNMVNWTVNCEVKVKFRDKDGFDLEDAWGWFPLILESSELKTFTRIAPSADAVDYTVIIQKASIDR